MATQELHSSSQKAKEPLQPVIPEDRILIKKTVYRDVLRQVLAKATNSASATKLLDKGLSQIEKGVFASQNSKAKKHPRRALRLGIQHDMRKALCDFIASTAESAKPANSRILPFMLWHIEKRMLMTHLNIGEQEFEELRARSGRGVSKFLQESLRDEGLID